MLDRQPKRAQTQVYADRKSTTSWLWLIGGAMLVVLDIWAFQAADVVWAQVLLGLLSGAALVWAVIRP